MPLWHDLRQISIHALREESDPTLRAAGRPSPISIHALREESDTLFLVIKSLKSLFQSTLSVRRATHGIAYGKQAR